MCKRTKGQAGIVVEVIKAKIKNQKADVQPKQKGQANSKMKQRVLYTESQLMAYK